MKVRHGGAAALRRLAPWMAVALSTLCIAGIVAILSFLDIVPGGRGDAALPAATKRARAGGAAGPMAGRALPASANATARKSGRASATAPAQVAPAVFVDLFPRQDWSPPQSAPVQEQGAPVPPAQPPPLPFSIGALWLDGSGAFYAVLDAQGREFPLCAACRESGFYREGDVLLGTYRIEKLTSREVHFLYLPMKRRQQMSLGG
ncbi:MAG TPA: hypothetical protein VIT90_12150 [Lysobacter sp.]